MTIDLSPECQRLISEQGGVLSARQARIHGLDSWVPRGRLRYGDWQRLHRGVYSTHTGRNSREADLWAALLRAGIEDAVLSHYTAAECHGFLKEPSRSIHIAVPERLDPARYSKIPGVVIHRSDAIVATCHPARVPRCTRVEDTVLDILKITKGFDARYSWICKAIGERCTTSERILAKLQERKRFPDRKEIQHMLGYAAEGITSWLELQWANGVERPHDLPRAQRQTRVVQGTGSRYLDNLYAGFRLCVELDGRAAHPESEQGRDRERDRWNLVNGNLVTMRFSTGDLQDQARRCKAAAEVARYLSAHDETGQNESIGHPCSDVCPVGRPVR